MTHWLRQTALEIWGLFVEDGSFALAIVLWMAFCVSLLPRILPTGWCGPAASAGLALILLENVARSARGR